MTRQAINVGTTAGDGTGDKVRAAFQKVNANETELYTRVGALETSARAFATAIPFSGSFIMDDYTVTGAIIFTIDGTTPNVGGECIATLIANGTNAPTFSGMYELSGSSPYVNSLNQVNQIYFFYDGIRYWYSVSTAVGGLTATTTDTTAPVLSTAAVQNAQPTKVVLTYNEPLATSSVPATSAYSIAGKTISAVAVSGSAVTLTVSVAFVSTDSISVSYTPGANPVKDIAGNNAASLSSQSVTNSVNPPDVTAPSISTSTVENSSRSNVVLTYSEALDESSIPATSDFTPSGGKTVSSVAISGAVVTVTVNSAYASGDTITISYTKGSNPIQDVAGNDAANLSSRSVTNNIGATPTATAVTFLTLTNLTDQGSETYAATSAGTSYAAQGVVGVSSAAGTETWIECQKPATGDGSAVLGFDVTSGSLTYGSNDYVAQVSTAGLIQAGQNTTAPASTGYTLTEGAGSRMRLHRSASNVVTVQTTTDDGANWTIQHTYAGTNTSTLYPHFYTTYSTTPRKMYQPRQYGCT